MNLKFYTNYLRKGVINMNIVLQQYNTGYFNVWEDVDINTKNTDATELAGIYRVHKYHKSIYDEERSYCSWSYKGLYLVKEIYGGFVEKIQKGTY